MSDETDDDITDEEIETFAALSGERIDRDVSSREANERSDALLDQMLPLFEGVDNVTGAMAVAKLAAWVVAAAPTDKGVEEQLELLTAFLEQTLSNVPDIRERMAGAKRVPDA